MLAGAGGAPLASIALEKQDKDKAEKIMALGQAKISLFLAEPVSDIIAATVTTIAFFTQFKKILRKTAKQKRQEIIFLPLIICVILIILYPIFRRIQYHLQHR